MGMPTIQKLYGNIKEHELELKRYKKNGDNKRKKSLALKASTSFDDDEDELDENESKEEDDEMTLLSKKFQRILREKRNKKRGSLCFERKILLNMTKEDLQIIQTQTYLL